MKAFVRFVWTVFSGSGDLMRSPPGGSLDLSIRQMFK
jgi:hypothetical protein